MGFRFTCSKLSSVKSDDMKRLYMLTNQGNRGSTMRMWLNDYKATRNSSYLDGTYDYNYTIMLVRDENHYIVGWATCSGYGLLGVYVDPQFRMQGLGYKLIVKLCERLSTKVFNARPSDVGGYHMYCKAHKFLSKAGKKIKIDYPQS